MKKKAIYKVLTTLKDFCKNKKYCRDCELYRSCFLSYYPCMLNDEGIKLVANVLKEFVDSEEVKDNGRSEKGAIN